MALIPVPETADIPKLWLNAQPGDTFLLAPGNYHRITLKPSHRPAGSPFVTFRAAPGTVRFLRDTTVGSTDTMLLWSGLRDALFQGIDFEIDDRAAIKTEGPGGAKKVSLIDCRIIGAGNALDPAWHDDSKWGQHHYFVGGWSEIGTQTDGVFKEHAIYHHQITGNLAWHGCKTRWCGRTRIQIVNRKAESGNPMPGPGKGDVTFVDDYVEDVCLEDGGGGSAYTFRGGMPDSTISLTNSKVRLGCNPDMAPPFNRSVTGALVMDSSGESAPGAGDDAFPGGTKELKLIEPDIEVGTVWPGEGNARRSNVKVGAVGEFLLDWGDTGRIVGGTNGIALEVVGSCKSFKFAGSPVEWKGKVKYKSPTMTVSVEYPDWTTFADQHPECRVG